MAGARSQIMKPRFKLNLSDTFILIFYVPIYSFLRCGKWTGSHRLDLTTSSHINYLHSSSPPGTSISLSVEWDWTEWPLYLPQTHHALSPCFSKESSGIFDRSRCGPNCALMFSLFKHLHEIILQIIGFEIQIMLKGM